MSSIDVCRAEVRALLLRWVLSGTSTVVAFQKMCGVSTRRTATSPDAKDEYVIRYPLVHYYFMSAAALGNELFYILFLPFLFWCVDVPLARRLSCLWGVVYFVGQSAKDLLRLPRPPSPPVTKLERHYEAEYGFPSTHAMISLVLPWYAIMVAASMEYPLHWPAAVAAATLWTASITLSRLYVGVHSVCDLAGGLALGALVLLFGHAAGPAVDAYLVSASLAPAVSLLVCLAAILSYPSPAEWTNAYGDTALIIAVVAGITVASSAHFVSYPSLPLAVQGDTPYEQIQSLCAGVLFKLLRMVVGSAILFTTRSVMKRVAQLIWLPFVLPKYFAFCSTLDSPTHSPEGVEATHGRGHGAAALPITGAAAPGAKDSWQLTPVPSSPLLHQRKGAKGAASIGAEVAASASASTPAGLASASGAALLRPKPLPPQQFRLSVLTSSGSGGGVGNQLRSGSPPPSPLEALLRAPSPPHSMLLDPSDPSQTPLASFTLAGRSIVINPMHVYLVEIPVKFVTYFAVGFNAVAVCPALFHLLGL